MRMAERLREISVFVDESGSFDSTTVPSRYYLVCFVLHDQAQRIDQAIEAFADSLAALGLSREHCVHAGPLIRREQSYVQISRDERRLIFSRMMAFIRHLDITYKCFAVDKRFITQTDAIHDNLLQQMLGFLLDNDSAFKDYDRQKVYYDNGQTQILSLLKEAFAIYSSKTTFVPEVTPAKYRLFQVADFLCTLELTRIKLENEHQISESEKQFFVSIQNLKKHYLKPIARKRA